MNYYGYVSHRVLDKLKENPDLLVINGKKCPLYFVWGLELHYTSKARAIRKIRRYKYTDDPKLNKKIADWVLRKNVLRLACGERKEYEPRYEVNRFLLRMICKYAYEGFKKEFGTNGKTIEG